MEELSETATENEESMACPTCDARQPWTDECRRCKSDLSDLRAVWQAGRLARDACLRALRAGRFDRALGHARRCVLLVPGDDATRLLAVCHLFRGEWAEAMSSVRESQTRN